MKNVLLPVVSIMVLMPLAFAEEPLSTKKEGMQKPPELTVEIVVDRYKEDKDEWDGSVGATPAPDVYGKIQLPERECEISVHEDSYIVKQTCPSTEMDVGTPVNLQLYDRDTLRKDDVIAIGTVQYQGDPTEVSIGKAKVRFWYSNSLKSAGNDKDTKKVEEKRENVPVEQQGATTEGHGIHAVPPGETK